MKKVLFIDRDGTIIREPADEQIDSLEKLSFLPYAISQLAKIALELDYILVMITNQDGLGNDSFPESTFWPAHNKMMGTLTNEGILFEDIYIDKSFPADNAATRKPATGLLGKYIYGDYDLANSFVIGDRTSDIQLAKNLGCKSILINKQADEAATLTKQKRVTSTIRKTKETQIDIELNLDGSGKSNVTTGLGFFDHMLDQIARHGNIDLDLKVNGDLEIDEHHTVEDTAITLGTAFKNALGSKKGIERYGFLLPMDDCLAQVSIDFGGRPWLVWEADFKRERVGDLPTEMFFHFFKSFSDAALCNLNIKAEGGNEHHKIESIFKAFAKAIKMAIAKTNQFSIPSTKGII
ncbi:UNVERIFIED_CONTAM: hypothetical protein GTU68_045062 [Idotea baltica]|nr:hypothetical protein [Idotea baltica]